MSAAVVRWMAGHDGSLDAAGAVEAWSQSHSGTVTRFQAVLEEIRSAGRLDLAGMSVAVRSLSSMARMQSKFDDL